MRTKLFKIYIPFVIASLGFVGLYTFFHWLIIIKLELIQPKEFIINFVLPFIVSGIFVIFYFRKRIKLLEIREKAWDAYTYICWILLFGPVIIGQVYFENNQGKLSDIEKPSLVDLKKQTLFYSIKHSTTLNKRGGLWVARTNADKSGSEIFITCYFVCPLVDTIPSEYYKSGKFDAWIGVSFAERFSNGAFDDKKEQNRKINVFINSSILKYEKYIYQTKYLRNLRNSDDRDEYYAAIERTNIYGEKKGLLVLEEEKGSYETRSGNLQKWFLGILISANLIWFLFIFFPSLNKKELRKFGTVKENKRKKRDLREFLAIFIPSRICWAPPIIWDLNILLFLVMVLSGVDIINPLSNDLIKWGADYKPLTTDGQWWRLLTSMFLHAGILHLLYNMIALFFIALFLESTIGSKKFMIIYLLTGLISSFTSLYFHESAVSLGASGAIFGMYGLLTALMILKYLDKNLTTMLWISIAIFIGANLISGLSSGIDMAAHLGGLISGFIIGITYFPVEKYLAEMD